MSFLHLMVNTVEVWAAHKVYGRVSVSLSCLSFRLQAGTVMMSPVLSDLSCPRYKFSFQHGGFLLSPTWGLMVLECNVWRKCQMETG